MCTIFVTHERNYIMGATPMTKNKIIMPVNVKMPTIGGILTLISMINMFESLKARNVLSAF